MGEITKEQLMDAIINTADSLIGSLDDEDGPLWIVDVNLSILRELLEMYNNGMYL